MELEGSSMNKNQYITVGELETILKDALESAESDASNSEDHSNRAAAYAVASFATNLLGALEYATSRDAA